MSSSIGNKTDTISVTVFLDDVGEHQKKKTISIVWPCVYI